MNSLGFWGDLGRGGEGNLRGLPLVVNGVVDLVDDGRKGGGSSNAGVGLEGKFPTLTREGLSTLQGLLEFNPKLRMTADEVLLSPYFKEEPLPCAVSLMPSFPSVHEK